MPAQPSTDHSPPHIAIRRGFVAFAAVLALALFAVVPSGGAEREAAPKALNLGKEQVVVEAKFFEIAAESPVAHAVLPWMNDAPGKVVEIFAPEQAAGLAAVLRATKEIDLLAAPSATTRSGQEVVIEIFREVRYPIDWKKDGRTGGWEPSEYGTKKVGTTLGALAKVQHAETIDLTLRPEIVKLVGFHDLDAQEDRPAAPANPGLDPDPRGRSIEPPPGIEERTLRLYAGDEAPTGRRARGHFAASKMERTLTIRPGESVLLELGTPPISEAAKRRIFVLATVKIVKPERGPAGVEIKAADAAPK